MGVIKALSLQYCKASPKSGVDDGGHICTDGFGQSRSQKYLPTLIGVRTREHSTFLNCTEIRRLCKSGS